MSGGTLEFAQARLQARHAARPGRGAWVALHAAISAPAVLEAARAGPLRKWVSGVRAEATLDETELALRERLREHIAEVASWIPAEWRDAMLWTQRLLDLPALQRLASTRKPLAWMKRDRRLEHEVPASGIDPDIPIRDQWTAHWRSLWPTRDREGCAALDEILAAFASHLDRFSHSDGAGAWALRESLQARLEILFRRHALTAGAAFAHVALTALDLERLRAEIVERMARRDLEAA